MLKSASLFYSHSKQSEKMSNNSLALSKSSTTVKNMIYTIFTTLFLFLTSSLYASDSDYIQTYKLKPVNEGIQIGLGTALSGSALICNQILHLKRNEYKPQDWDKNSLPKIDQIFMRPYNKKLHIVGTATLGVAMATPFILTTAPSSEWATIGTMYAETMLLTNGILQWTKFLVHRARPYMYFDGYSQAKVDAGDWNCSFPSGHTGMSFSGAAFTTSVFCHSFPNSKWKAAVAGFSFGIAALTGGLRMASGNHFFTDVLAGATIGTACGFIIPALHHQKSRPEKDFDITTADAIPPIISFNIGF